MLKDREGFTPAIVLTVVCIITAFLLAMTYGITKEKIDANALGEQGIAMQELFTDADAFTPAAKSEVNGITGLYEAKKGGSVVGYVAIAEATGFGGKVPVMVGFNTDKTLAGVSIKNTLETPGYGKKSEEASYQAQFKGKPADKEFSFKGEAGKTPFDQVSGATITSTAIQAALNSAVQAVQALGK